MIKRYYPQQCCLGRDIHMEQQPGEGSWVKYKDHKKILKKMKEEIEKAALERLEKKYQKIYESAYEKGWQNGYNVGCEQ